MLDEWHTYAGKLSGGQLSLEIDGTAVASKPFTGVPATTGDPFHLGAVFASASGLWGPFQGLVEDVKLYDR